MLSCLLALASSLVLRWRPRTARRSRWFARSMWARKDAVGVGVDQQRHQMRGWYCSLLVPSWLTWNADISPAPRPRSRNGRGHPEGSSPADQTTGTAEGGRRQRIGSYQPATIFTTKIRKALATDHSGLSPAVAGREDYPPVLYGEAARRPHHGGGPAAFPEYCARGFSPWQKRSAKTGRSPCSTGLR